MTPVKRVRKRINAHISMLVVVPIVKVVRETNSNIDHEVLSRGSLGDGRYSYHLACGGYVTGRARWHERLPTCLACIAAKPEDP